MNHNSLTLPQHVFLRDAGYPQQYLDEYSDEELGMVFEIERYHEALECDTPFRLAPGWVWEEPYARVVYRPGGATPVFTVGRRPVYVGPGYPAA